MCGIAGFVESRLDTARRKHVAAAMGLAIAHRGPDAADTWIDRASGTSLSHRRLSIIDLSAAGHQPMHSHSGRFVIVFNGEIYNHLEIRDELAATDVAPAWRGHSDTETLLAAVEKWGVEKALLKTVGMFAIALYDRVDRRLWLARDRFGEKPLYYGWTGSGLAKTFLFGSELKALRAFPEFNNEVCRLALMQYMRFTVVPAPRSIYEGVFKLEPGCLLTVDGEPPRHPPAAPLRPGQNHGSIAVRRWWSFNQIVERASNEQITSEGDGIAQLESVLSRAVKDQSLADVPLGAFLSGGVDSSTIVALMQRQSSHPVKTFTIGFEEAAYDESDHARAVAHHLGTLHTELFITSSETQSVIPLLPEMYDEPFADSSQIPTHLVCRAARQHVTVALSGDAGDELFGGYNRYFWGPRIWDRVAWLPYSIRKQLGALIGGVPIAAWDALGKPANALAGKHGVAHFGDKMHKLAKRLDGVRSLDELYVSLVSEWQDPAAVVRSWGLQEPQSVLDDPIPREGMSSAQLRMMYWDTCTYLPDDILCKVDRAAMATSLETRVPFLDHRLVELAWRLPLNMKIRGHEGKWALRQVLYKYVPRELIERPKAGFGIPVGQWIRGPLRDWAENLLCHARLEREGFFHPEPIRARWKEHLDGSRDHTHSLWSVLMFQAWNSTR
jgi:asparagine synthase (glutamine-hydrolysing)